MKAPARATLSPKGERAAIGNWERAALGKREMAALGTVEKKHAMPSAPNP